MTTCVLCFSRIVGACVSTFPKASELQSGEEEKHSIAVEGKASDHSACRHQACVDCAKSHLHRAILVSGVWTEQKASVNNEDNDDSDHEKPTPSSPPKDVYKTTIQAPVQCPGCSCTVSVVLSSTMKRQHPPGLVQIADVVFEHHSATMFPPMAQDPKGKVGKKGASATTNSGASPEDASLHDNSLVALSCGICEEADGVVECVQCKFALCEGCQKSVHAKGRFKQHTVVPIGTLSATSPVKCKLHEQYNEELFCEQCSVPMCLLCSFQGAHKGHPAKPLQDVIEEVKGAIESQMKVIADSGAHAIALRDHLRASGAVLADQHHALAQGIQESFTRLRNELSQRERIVLRDLQGVYDERHMDLSRSEKAVGALCDELEAVKASVEKVVGSGPMLPNILAIAPAVRGRLEGITHHAVIKEALAVSEDSVESWAKRYSPSLDDLVFKLRPARFNEVNGRDSTGSCNGDDEFALLLQSTGELSVKGPQHRKAFGLLDSVPTADQKRHAVEPPAPKATLIKPLESSVVLNEPKKKNKVFGLQAEFGSTLANLRIGTQHPAEHEAPVQAPQRALATSIQGDTTPRLEQVKAQQKGTYDLRMPSWSGAQEGGSAGRKRGRTTKSTTKDDEDGKGTALANGQYKLRI